MPRWLLLAALSAAFATSANAQAPKCRDSEKPMLRAELVFGRNIGDRFGVSERQWARFLARELTPRFPGGLTVIDGAGQWRDSSNGKIVREKSKIVMLIVADDAPARERIDAAVAAYQHQFRQQAVGLILGAVCSNL